jgi:heat shock protein HslJ
MRIQGLAQAGIALGLALAMGGCGGPGDVLTGIAREAEKVGVDPHANDGLGIVGSWRLVALTEAGKPTVTVPQPDRFTAEFRAEGVVSLQADCNRCLGAFKAGGDGTLSIGGNMACQLAYCPSAPLDTTFASLVSNATTWTATDGGLELRSPAGVLQLRR